MLLPTAYGEHELTFDEVLDYKYTEMTSTLISVGKSLITDCIIRTDYIE